MNQNITIEIQKLIAEGNLKKSFETLLEFLQENDILDLHRETTILSSQFHQIKREKRLGIYINNGQLSRITFGLLEVLEQVRTNHTQAVTVKKFSGDNNSFGQTTEKKVEINLPSSRYVKSKNVVFKGSNEGVFCWGQLVPRKDGYLPRIGSKDNIVSMLNIRILIYNTEDNLVSFRKKQCSLILKPENDNQKFVEKKSWEKYIKFKTEIIEKNKKDISMKEKSSIKIRREEWFVVDFTYPLIHYKIKEIDAINLCKNIEFNYDMNNETRIMNMNFLN